MISCDNSLFRCYLSDRDGRPLNPTVPGSVLYRNLSFPDSYGERQALLLSGRVVSFATAAIWIGGYVTVSSQAEQRTLPFRTVQNIQLPFSQPPALSFATRGFRCSALRACAPSSVRADFVQILIDIETAVLPFWGEGQNLRPGGDEGCGFFTHIHVLCRLTPLFSESCQYIALGNGAERVFTDEEEQTEYGRTGILSPGTASLCRLFVNGVLQPPANYTLQKGRLELKTEDVPGEGVPLSLSFLRIMDGDGRKLDAESRFYVAAADGTRTRYTDGDNRPEYGTGGIPGPDEVSCQNLFVNGILQPKAVYRLERGLLELCEPPGKGEWILLESLLVRDPSGRLLDTSESQYVARSRGSRFFTDQDASQQYRSAGIASPALCSYQDIFVNGVLQPKRTYLVQSGSLTFLTDDVPAPGNPVTQQAVSVFE